MLDKETVEGVIANHRENPGARLLQKTLAREVTELIHGRDRRESVERVTAVLFGGEDFGSLNDADLDALAAEIPAVAKGNSVIETLTTSGVVASNGEAKRLIAGGAVSINGQKITDDSQITDVSLVKKGKNNFVLVR